MNTKRVLSFLAVMAFVLTSSLTALASSHREAPLISNDPLADNTDLYVFRSPGPTVDDQNTITIIANYIPFELPEGGPNYFNFGENIRYEIHIRNQAASTPAGNGDDITYRFTFTNKNNALILKGGVEVTAAAKYRAARVIWARTMRDRFGAKNPDLCYLR